MWGFYGAFVKRLAIESYWFLLKINRVGGGVAGRV
jgi:hypothetical protein